MEESNIIHVNGDVLTSKTPIIAHQVNCQGVMGGGLALQIKNKYPLVFEEYKEFCKNSSYIIMGLNLFVKTNDEDTRIVCNMFAQDKYGREKRQTDYEALKKCLESLASYCNSVNLDVSLPYNLGCGLAGGDWNMVYPMIVECFEKLNTKCYIYKL